MDTREAVAIIEQAIGATEGIEAVINLTAEQTEALDHLSTTDVAPPEVCAKQGVHSGSTRRDLLEHILGKADLALVETPVEEFPGVLRLIIRKQGLP